VAKKVIGSFSIYWLQNTTTTHLNMIALHSLIHSFVKLDSKINISSLSVSVSLLLLVLLLPDEKAVVHVAGSSRVLRIRHDD
jgi:hypothetical protein